MIKISNIETHGWEAAIRGMRNPMNSWARSDSELWHDPSCGSTVDCSACNKRFGDYCFAQKIGQKDFALMLKLANAGTDHAKYRRMITVTMDILAPLYWWKEFDTYKVGTVANSCSTIHNITEKEFTLDDFSHEHLIDDEPIPARIYSPMDMMRATVKNLNMLRTLFLEGKDKKYWWQIIQLLPTSYNQLRTVQCNYEVLSHIYHARKDHKLDEWRDLCGVIKTLPYSQLITLEE